MDISVKGANGVVESAADEQLTCRVKGGVLLGFGSADPCTTEAYDTGKFTTYYGRHRRSSMRQKPEQSVWKQKENIPAEKL